MLSVGRIQFHPALKSAFNVPQSDVVAFISTILQTSSSVLPEPAIVKPFAKANALKESRPKRLIVKSIRLEAFVISVILTTLKLRTEGSGSTEKNVVPALPLSDVLHSFTVQVAVSFAVVVAGFETGVNDKAGGSPYVMSLLAESLRYGEHKPSPISKA